MSAIRFRSIGPRIAIAIAFIAFAAAALAPAAEAAFPGSNGRIVFASYPRTPPALEEIFIIRPNGTGRTQLTDNGGALVSNVAPDWSPAGTRIAYQHSSPTDSRIVIIRPGGRRVGSVNDASCRYGVGRPAWSPSGDMAYTCFDRFSTYIKTVDLGSGTRHRITFGEFDMDPEYSPAGDAIAYVEAGGDYSSVIVVSLDGSGEPDGDELIAGDPTEGAGSPDWNPAGTHLAYPCAPLAPVSDADLCMAPVTAPHTETVIAGSANVEQGVAFAPSGGRFVYAVGPEDDDTELKIRSLTLGPLSTLTSNRVVDQQPDWGTD